MESLENADSFSRDRVKMQNSLSFSDVFFSRMNKPKRQKEYAPASDFETWFNFSFIMAASLFLAGGILVGGLGIWIMVCRWKIPKTMHPKQIVLVAVPCIALVIAIISPVISWLSCLSFREDRNQKFQILVPSALGFVAIILMTIGAVLCYHFRDSLADEEGYLKNKGAAHNKVSDVPWRRDLAHQLSFLLNRAFPGSSELEEWEDVQSSMSCCGVYGYKDWLSRRSEHPIPMSCCMSTYKALNLTSQGCSYDAIAQIGCLEKIGLTLRYQTTMSGNIFLVCISVYNIIWKPIKSLLESYIRIYKLLVEDYGNWFITSFFFVAALFFIGGAALWGLVIWLVSWSLTIPNKMYPRLIVFVAAPCVATVGGILSPIITRLILRCIKRKRIRISRLILPSALGFVAIKLLLIGAHLCYQFQSMSKEVFEVKDTDIVSIRDGNIPWQKMHEYILMDKLDRSVPESRELQEWNVLQASVPCCGINNFRDWFARELIQLPSSCCIQYERALEIVGNDSDTGEFVCCELHMFKCEEGGCWIQSSIMDLDRVPYCPLGIVNPLGCKERIIAALSYQTLITGRIFLTCSFLFAFAEMIMGMLLFVRSSTGREY